MKLSRCMTELLRELARDSWVYVPSWSRQQTRTATALARRGLATGTPVRTGGGAHYTITDVGRVALAVVERGAG